MGPLENTKSSCHLPQKANNYLLEVCWTGMETIETTTSTVASQMKSLRNADLLSNTISDIINSSFAERRLPPSWKSADTVPIPKQKPIKDVNKHLRPISLTSILSKVAEEFVVAEYLRPSILKKIGDNQFGAIPKSSTTHALISLVHSWAKHTDGTGSTVRVVLFDYRKAFDLIDHALLAGKLLALDIPVGVSFWVIDFLTDRTQRVKLGEDCLSEWRNVPAGVPQGTKLGPWLFILMIDDINTSNTNLWRYVDDTTIAEKTVVFNLMWRN